MKTRLIALLIALVVVLMSFASCGLFGGGDDPEDPEQGGQGTGGDDNTSSYPWSTTNLVFQMTENSQLQELPSTCKRYLAGDTKDVEDISTIDE